MKRREREERKSERKKRVDDTKERGVAMFVLAEGGSWLGGRHTHFSSFYKKKTSRTW